MRLLSIARIILACCCLLYLGSLLRRADIVLPKVPVYPKMWCAAVDIFTVFGGSF